MGARLGVLLVGMALAACAAPIAGAGLILVRPDPGVGATFVGHGGYSADGLGQTATGGTLQADVPAGSHVEHAWLYGSYAIKGGVPASDLAINLDGANVRLKTLQSINAFLTSARADVTAQIARKVGTGGGVSSFTVNTDPATLDGVALVVVYSNPKLPTTTIAVLDGAASPAGDTATFAFSKPLDPAAAGFQATLSLGSGHSYQGEPGHVCGTMAAQSSLVDVNGKRLTSCAGSYDDGQGANGGLITVGGVGDSTDDPANPGQKPMDGSTPRTTDDELYDVKPLLAAGDTQLAITTSNPSGDDLVFLAVVSVTGEAAVTTVSGGGAPPPPVLGKTFNAQVVSGKVLCRAKGSVAFKPLTAAVQLHVGSECDATHGAIRITSAAGSPQKPARLNGARLAAPIQSALFFAGRFAVRQKPAKVPITDLTLSGGDFKKTCARQAAGLSGGAAADPLVRKVWGRGKGHFRTRGRYSSGTVRGTYWVTEDHCFSTVIRVRQGTVVVDDVVRHKEITVHAGHMYVAKAPGHQQKGVARSGRRPHGRSWLPWLLSRP
jgi:hypothetical protein